MASSLILVAVSMLLVDFGHASAFLLFSNRNVGTDSKSALRLDLEGDAQGSNEKMPHHELRRRDLFSETATRTGVMASLLVAAASGFPTAGRAAEEERQTIVITGANSGIGFEACKRLAQQGHRLVLSCRTQAKAEDAVERLIKEESTSSALLVPAECNLASTASIRAFADRLPTLIGGQVDCLCLNAGVSRNTAAKDVARTADGFELTGKTE